MPNRLLKDGLRSSGPINGLSDRAFRLYVNLLLCADDFALLDWCYPWVKMQAWALQTGTEQELAALMTELEKANLVRSYENGKKRFAAIEKWEQRRNASKPKFPMPPWGKEHILGGYVAPRAREHEPEKKTKAKRKANGAQPPKISFDYSSAKFCGIVDADYARWQEAYPAVPVPDAVEQAAAWAKANPVNRKSNWERFIVAWLKRSQDKAPRFYK